MDSGYWTKFEVKVVEADERIPHGYKPKRKRYGAGKVTWDHRHLREKVAPYEFESAASLLVDFWHEVDRIVDGE
jgi:hypothetical protein